MLHNLLKARRILKQDPKTNKSDLLQQSGLTIEEFNSLISNSIVEKRGNTKGAEWHWIGEKPDYGMVQSLLGKTAFKGVPTILDVVVDKYELSMKITDNVTLRLISDKSVGLRRDDGQEVVVSDPVRLKEILSLIS